MDKFNAGMNENTLQIVHKNTNDVADILPMLDNLSQDKLEQLKSIIKLIGGQST